MGNLLTVIFQLIKTPYLLHLGREIKTKILYQTINENHIERVESALLFPLKNDKKRIIGILEIANIYNDLFGFDEEYFGIVLSEFSNHAFINLMKQEILKNEIK